MALLTPQAVVATTGTQPTFSAVNASDTFVPSAGRFLYVKNTNAATRTVTITTTGTAAGGAAIADWSGTVGATTGELIFPAYPAQHLQDGTTGVATVTYSATAGVTAALIELPAIP